MVYQHSVMVQRHQQRENLKVLRIMAVLYCGLWFRGVILWFMAVMCRVGSRDAYASKKLYVIGRLLKHDSHFEADYICFPISKIPRPVLFQLLPPHHWILLVKWPMQVVSSFYKVFPGSDVCVIFSCNEMAENMGDWDVCESFLFDFCLMQFFVFRGGK